MTPMLRRGRSISVRASVRCLALGLGLFSNACIRTTKTVDRRIDQVLAGLRPRVAIKGAPALRWTLRERMASLHVPGVSIAVIDSGRIVWARGAGVKEIGTADSVTAETLFQAQSISKPVAATAMLRLVEAGKLSLDRDVNGMLDSWKLPESRFTTVRKVTLRRITSHSAGITVGGFIGYALGDSIPTLVQILNGVRPANSPPILVDTFPGAMWRYSGGGMLVMQQLMIDATGEPFPALMRRLVLTPAGMRLSTYDQPLPETRRREAAGGHNSEGSLIKGKWPIQPEMAAAGLWTTPTELARWALDLSNAWAGRPGKLLSRSMAREMLTVQTAPSGLGPVLEDSGSAFRFGHSGANRGFRAEFVMFPALGKGAVVMTNADLGSDLIDELFQSVAAEYQWPHYGQVERAVVVLGSGRLEGLIGDYLTPGPGNTPVVIEVRREGQHLFLELKGFRPKGELYPAGADSFFTSAGSDVVFTRDRSGRSLKVNLARQIEATRAR